MELELDRNSWPAVKEKTLFAHRRTRMNNAHATSGNSNQHFWHNGRCPSPLSQNTRRECQRINLEKQSRLNILETHMSRKLLNLQHTRLLNYSVNDTVVFVVSVTLKYFDKAYLNSLTRNKYVAWFLSRCKLVVTSHPLRHGTLWLFSYMYANLASLTCNNTYGKSHVKLEQLHVVI